MYMPQAAAISVETEIVAPIYFDVKTLPAPVNCKKRALQVEVKTKQQQQADDCGATCRYQLTQALIISKWALSREEKQPLLGLSWIQGQSASSLLFVALDETPLEPGVVERVDG